MKNVKTSIKGNLLVIEVDLSKKGELSKSEKNLVIASTQGNQSVDGKPEVKFGLNVYTAAPAKA